MLSPIIALSQGPWYCFSICWIAWWNISPCSLLKSPRFSWKKSRCEYKKWSFKRHATFHPKLWLVFWLSVYNLDLYSFSKTSTTPRNACQAFFSVSVIFSSRILDFNVVVICRPTNFPLFSLASDNYGNTALIPWNFSPLQSKALTDCFNEPNFMWRSGSKTLQAHK